MTDALNGQRMSAGAGFKMVYAGVLVILVPGILLWSFSLACRRFLRAPRRATGGLLVSWPRPAFCLSWPSCGYGRLRRDTGAGCGFRRPWHWFSPPPAQL